MKLEYAFLADAAQVSQGKFYVIGGDIDRIWSKEFPCVHPHMTLIAKFTLEPGELERPHQLEIILMDEDGKKIGGPKGEMYVERNPQNESWRTQGFLFTFNLLGLKFERPGEYSFEIIVNGSNMKSLPLRLMEQIEEPAGA